MKATAKKKLAIVLISCAAFFIVSGSLTYASWQKYQNKIYPDLYLGDYQLGGLTQAEALDFLIEKSRTLENQGLKFKQGNQEISISHIITAGPDSYGYEIFSIDPNKNLENILSQQGQGFFAYIKHRLSSLFKDIKIKAVINLNQENLLMALRENWQDQEIPAINASFVLLPGKDIELQIEPEKSGKIIDYQSALIEVKNNLQNLENPTIILKTKTEHPSVYQADLPSLKKEAENILKRGELELIFEEKKWLVEKKEIATWFKTERKSGNLKLELDEEKIINFLQEKIAPEIDKEAVLPRFSMINDKLANWQVGRDGQKLNQEKSAIQISQEFIEGNKNSISLIVDTLEIENLNPENHFNIKEIIGTGYSSFAGSPSNRRHNIKVGADTLHGILIKPGEEFSLIGALGAIDASSGYLPELVIKDNRTIPEYGGGLCQIGTTVFRTALQSGLPITERRNHSYRVSYYEPAGTDATIYDPKPDVRFLNDTGNYILIQARIEGSDLYFDFWGVKDGRQVNVGEPVIYNIVKPAPTKIVESPDLKPGEKKCTESAHNGADAYFDYEVTYPLSASSTEPEIKKVRFSSHYVPWQAVCLVGATATSTATGTPAIATSTEATTSPNITE